MSGKHAKEAHVHDLGVAGVYVPADGGTDFAMVIGHTTTWFSNENLGGEQPRDAKGNCLYYQDTNPYWVDMCEAMDRFTPSYDYTRLSTYYADLVEYIVMTVRLYFFIREKQFRPIDRGKYDELVGVKAALPTPA